MELSKNNLNNIYTLIEYPGIVKNVDKAINTLGGMTEISKAISKKNRRLELWFRPGDVFCKPTCGDRYETQGLLIKVKYKVKSNSEGESQKVISCDIVGRVNTAYKFKSICDFQYLPMELSPTGKMESISENMLPKEVDGNNLKLWLEKPASYFLPPAAFSRIDTQSLNSYMYRRDNREKVNDGAGPLIGRTRKRRSGHAIFVSFNIPKIPSKPRDKALKLLDVKLLSGQPLERVKKCFAERPIWSKLALICVTSYNHDQLKYLLPSVAYYFVTGPFRVMWVRLGYDPRTDPSSRIYQTLDYRLRAPGLLSMVKAKRSYANYILPSKASHATAKSIVITKFDGNLEGEEVSSDQIKKDSYIYQPSVIPPARQMFYQYCDVKAPEIEAMLARLPKVPPCTTCDPKHGWLPPGFDTQCRDIISVYLIKALRKEAANLGSSSNQEEEEVPDDESDNEGPWGEEFDDEEVDSASDEG